MNIGDMVEVEINGEKVPSRVVDVKGDEFVADTKFGRLELDSSQVVSQPRTQLFPDAQDIGVVYESEDRSYVEMPETDIIKMIEDSDPDRVADRDYVSLETGEFIWEKGVRAGDTQYHPDHERPVESPHIWVENGYSYYEELQNFEDAYDVIKEPLGRFNSEEWEHLSEYDVDTRIPVSVRRPDGNTITDNDIDNVENYIEVWNESHESVELYLGHAVAGDTVVTLSFGMKL